AHMLSSRNHKGEVTTAVWNSERKVSEIDTTGIETQYEYDVLNRVTKQTKVGISAGGGFPAQPNIATAYEYDAEGRQTKMTLADSLTNKRTFDKAGRLISQTDAAGLTTTFTYVNGERKRTIIRPGGATEISDQYLDGQQKSKT